MALIRTAVVSLLVLVGLAALAGAGLRVRDRRSDAALSARLLALRQTGAPAFDPAALAGLPEPARRYLARAIAPGTPLVTVVTLRMAGSFRLNGQPLPLRATEVLAPPLGFLWQARIGTGLRAITGSDGLSPARDAGEHGWMRFAIGGLVPVVRAGGTPDHLRSAGTRALMEAIWAPASLLPQSGAVWRQTGTDSVAVWFPTRPDIAPMQITVGPDGLPLSASALRWSDANPEKTFRLQPFGGTFSAWTTFDGFTIPVEVEMGNHFGSPDYDRFFAARITEARYRPQAVLTSAPGPGVPRPDRAPRRPSRPSRP